MDGIKALAIAAGVGAVSAVVIAVGMAWAGEWVFYSHEYAHVGLKFAPGHKAGCGVEIPTALGRAAGLDWPLYCEQSDGGAGYVEGWFTIYG